MTKLIVAVRNFANAPKNSMFYLDNHIRNVKELCGRMQSALSVTVGGVSNYIRVLKV